MFLDRANVIKEKGNYILNHWTPLQKLLKVKASCAMESYISHSLASVFTCRPKGFSKMILAKRLRLRAMFLNSFDDKKVFHTFINSTYTVANFNKLHFSILDDMYKGDTLRLILNLNLLPKATLSL